MSSIAKQLADKIAAEGLNQTQAAKAIGVSLPSFRGVISGKSTPNKRSADRYAAFLGIAVDDVLAAKATGGEPAKRRGRKPGRKPGRPAGAAKPGRKPGRKGKNSEGSISEALKAIAIAVEAAEVLLSDDLAVAVHGLDKRTREKIAFLIG